MINVSPYWIILLPLLGALFQSLFSKLIFQILGEHFGKKFIGFVATLCVTLAFVCVCINSYYCFTKHPSFVVYHLTNWISVENLSIPIEFLIDPLSLTLSLIITGIGTLIHLYAIGYMFDDKGFARFFAYMNLFIAFMLLLVQANNLPLMFIGWEGVGVCSYLLIGFWYRDLKNTYAASKAFIVNRIGDVALLLGMLALIPLTFSLGESRVLSFDILLGEKMHHFITQHPLSLWIALLFVIGAIGKSAQFPLYIWLPDAMAGPTPVSALIHAATMVTAGVYLLTRMQILLMPASFIIATIGIFTALWGALIALSQTDIKKVLAYSTVSQLGYMFLACGTGAYFAAIFHLITHAFFKALLFLSAGSVIYSMNHEQEMGNYGNLSKYLRFTYVTMGLGALCMFFPYTSGFWSKEKIFEGSLIYPYYFWVSIVVSLLTGVYILRMTFLTFLGKKERWRLGVVQNEPTHVFHNPDVSEKEWDSSYFHTDLAYKEDDKHHLLAPNYEPREVPLIMRISPGILLMFALFIGYFLSPNHNPKFQKFLQQSLGWKQMNDLHDPEAHLLTYFSVLTAFLAIIYTVWQYGKKFTYDDFNKENSLFFSRISYKQFGYDAFLVHFFRNLGERFVRSIDTLFDRGVIDHLISGLGNMALGCGEILKILQNGYLRSYMLWMLLSIVAMGAYLIWMIQQVRGI